jgi:hypothetical protein
MEPPPNRLRTESGNAAAWLQAVGPTEMQSISVSKSSERSMVLNASLATATAKDRLDFRIERSRGQSEFRGGAGWARDLSVTLL